MVPGYISEIRPFAFDAVPENWMPCNGQKLQIREHQALYSLVGNLYGSDGHSTFQLPDLRNALAIHWSERHAAGERVQPSSGVPTEEQGVMAVNYCICIDGIYPSR